MSQIVDDLRQVAIEIKTETQVGGNTAARVGGAFESVADALEGTQQIEDMDAAVAAVQQAAAENEQTIQDIVNSLAVVQATGDSTSNVMSQKAVTDAIVVESMDGQGLGLDVADEAGFVIARFRSGFDSNVCPSQESEENVELDIADENGNVIVRFANGHIYTKLFDSSQSGGGGSSSKKSIKILFLGNSVTQDHATYLPWLLKNTYGVENIEFAISIFYCGGSSGTIKEYATTIADGGRNAEIFSSVVNTDVWTNETDISLDTALARQEWDVISIQGWANGTNEDVTYIPTLIEKLVAKMNHPFELAYLINQTPSAKPTILVNTAKQVCRDYSISMLFPPALVTEYARQAWGTEFISPDGGHNREGLPCIMTAYSIMLILCRRMGLWDAVIGNELRITAAEIERMHIPGQNGSLVATTDAQYLQAQEFAVMSVNAADAIFNEAKTNCLNNLMN